MKKNLEISILLDFYRELLTEKQADTIELYYNHDLSLSEISEHLDITRQAVRDSIKRGEKLLYELEEKLGLVKRFHAVKAKIRTIEGAIREMEELNNDKLFSDQLENKINFIKHTLKDIYEKV